MSITTNHMIKALIIQVMKTTIKVIQLITQSQGHSERGGGGVTTHHRHVF